MGWARLALVPKTTLVIMIVANDNVTDKNYGDDSNVPVSTGFINYVDMLK